MKCPKCGYISFDFNLACPKCNKDVSLEQEKLNIPAFRPDPPSLLGGLLGDPPGMQGSGLGEETAAQEPALSTENEESGSGEAGLDDSQEIDLDFELQAEKGLEVEGILEEHGNEVEAGDLPGNPPQEVETAPPEKTEILGAISLDESEVFPEKQGAGDQEEISLDLDEITLEPAQPAEAKPGSPPEGKVESDLGDFSLEDAGVKLEQAAPPLSSTEPLELDLDSISLGDGQAPAGNETDEIALSLEDLKVNETGQLEIGRHIAAAATAKAAAQSKPPAVDATTEVAPLTMEKEDEDDLSLLLSDDSIEISTDPPEGVQAIDLENLDLELDLEGAERKGNS